MSASASTRAAFTGCWAWNESYAAEDSRRGHRRVRALRPRRRARRPHRGARAGKQAHAVLLLRRQGWAVPGGARGPLRPHPQCRALARARAPRPARRGAAPGGVHLEVLPRAPRVPDAAQQREPAQGAPRTPLAPRARDAFAPGAAAARRAAPGRGAGPFPQGCRPGAALHLDRRRGLLLPEQPLYAVAHLRPRPDGAARPCRACAAYLGHDSQRTEEVT